MHGMQGQLLPRLQCRVPTLREPSESEQSLRLHDTILLLILVKLEGARSESPCIALHGGASRIVVEAIIAALHTPFTMIKVGLQNLNYPNLSPIQFSADP